MAFERTRWQCGLSLSQGLSKLRLDNILTDVKFVVGLAPPVTIHAHKVILASRSPVFYAMFEGLLAETGEIKVPDMDRETFNAILRYM